MGFLRWLNMPITYIYFVVVVFAGASMVNNAIETAVPNEQIDWASGTVYFLMYSTMIYFFLRGVWGGSEMDPISQCTLGRPNRSRLLEAQRGL